MMIDPTTRNLGDTHQVECSSCFNSATIPTKDLLPLGWTTITSRLANPRNPEDIRYLADYYCSTECFNLAIEEMADGTPLPDDHYNPLIWETKYYERD